MEPSVPLVKFVKNLLYRKIRYIEGKLIYIDYDNPFQVPTQIYQDFTYVPFTYRSPMNHNAGQNPILASIMQTPD
ncbi:uncharacterized protein OCT59_006036 [Rhizophagus irregularis]|uniref:Uncharacterized protein n=1 Tax=Rhizophagus irregularis (strain DAOM 197198w) TaxID=1432141 RepID=A0A015LNF1_RHIIW|nr:hypothetical protein RirG_217440 [Rhizophagus irregularis DAOM 197198w]UZO14580.1 hypothetical protein OCT59_006036 [Rhizophagus irregularis]GBC38321.1 hypothetical protein GLOIN_2v1783681 [Rhizophagus irregularis DAOM 181602=DAOM 197198]